MMNNDLDIRMPLKFTAYVTSKLCLLFLKPHMCFRKQVML
uniref:Uncharacterized protein n=1 Tax=Arundo donax TaxID=35708 RepID=A0A0A9CAI2_ARUDO